MSDNTQNTAVVERDEKGRVAPGSGGALGATSSRRLGTGEAAKIRGLVQPQREALVTRLLEIAKSGAPKDSVRAAEVLLNRLAAPPKAQSELVRIDGLAEAATLEEKCAAVVRAVGTGQVSAEAGRSVLQMLDAVARVRRVDELEARIKRLEGRTIAPAADDDAEALV